MEPFQKLVQAIQKPLQVLWFIFVILAVLVFTYLFYWMSAVAENDAQSDRPWLSEQELAVTAAINSDESYTLYNVRDWMYGDKSVVSQVWKDVTVHPKDITKMWFVLEPFSDWEAVGHTLLTFEFADGTTLSFSVEARREADEEYSALQGMTPKYELAYQWGTERDFVTRRLLYLDHPLRRYPLNVTPEQAQAIFTALIDETAFLEKYPRWYNTMLDNCTNTLAHEVNKLAPDALPYDISWNLTGYADRYLMKEGWINKIDNSVKKTQEQFDLTKQKAEILESAQLEHPEFTALLNGL